MFVAVRAISSTQLLLGAPDGNKANYILRLGLGENTGQGEADTLVPGTISKNFCR